MQVSLPVYRQVSVPIYYYPPPQELQAIKELLVKKYGTVKRAKHELRRRFRCFLSENAIWRTKVYVQPVDESVEPPVKPRVTLINVMARGVKPLKDFDYLSFLRERGFKLNPYRSMSGDENKTPFCFGFYSSTFDKLASLVDDLGKRGLVDGAIIVNAVWYLRLDKPIDLSKLVNTGMFVSSMSNFKAVTGIVEGVKVTVFNTGTIRVVRAPTPEIARDVLGKTYAIMLNSNAIIGG